LPHQKDNRAQLDAIRAGENFPLPCAFGGDNIPA
jgi:hypothetical protein